MRVQDRHYFRNFEQFMRDDANFDNRSDEELLALRDRIAGWIGLPIDQRPMLADGMIPFLCRDLTERERIALLAIHRLGWARGLRNKTIRLVIADCIKFVCDHDECMLEELKKGFE